MESVTVVSERKKKTGGTSRKPMVQRAKAPAPAEVDRGDPRPQVSNRWTVEELQTHLPALSQAQGDQPCDIAPDRFQAAAARLERFAEIFVEAAYAPYEVLEASMPTTGLCWRGVVYQHAQQIDRDLEIVAFKLRRRDIGDDVTLNVAQIRDVEDQLLCELSLLARDGKLEELKPLFDENDGLALHLRPDYVGQDGRTLDNSQSVGAIVSFVDEKVDVFPA